MEVENTRFTGHGYAFVNKRFTKLVIIPVHVHTGFDYTKMLNFIKIKVNIFERFGDKNEIVRGNKSGKKIGK